MGIRKEKMKSTIAMTCLLLTAVKWSWSRRNSEPCFKEDMCHFSYSDTCQWSTDMWSVKRDRLTRNHRFNYLLTLDSGSQPGVLTSPVLCPDSSTPSSPHCLRFDFRFGHVLKLLPDSLTVSLETASDKWKVAPQVLWNVSAVNRDWHAAIVSIPVSAHVKQIRVTAQRLNPPWSSSVIVDNVQYQAHPCVTIWSPEPPLPSSSTAPSSSPSSQSPSSSLSSVSSATTSIISNKTTTIPDLSPDCFHSATCLKRTRACEWEVDSRQWYLDYVMGNYRGRWRKLYSAYLRHNVTSGTVQSPWLCSAAHTTALTWRGSSNPSPPHPTGQPQKEAVGAEGEWCVWLWLFLHMGHRYTLTVQLLQDTGPCSTLLTLSLWTAQHRWRYVSLPVPLSAAAAASSPSSSSSSPAPSRHKIRIMVERREWSNHSVVAVDTVSYGLKRHCPVVLPDSDADVTTPPEPSPCVTSRDDTEVVPRHIMSASSTDEGEYEQSQFILRLVVVILGVAVVVIAITLAVWCRKRRRVPQKRRYDVGIVERNEMNNIGSDVIHQISSGQGDDLGEGTTDMAAEVLDGDDVYSIISNDDLTTTTTTTTTCTTIITSTSTATSTITSVNATNSSSTIPVTTTTTSATKGSLDNSSSKLSEPVAPCCSLPVSHHSHNDYVNVQIASSSVHVMHTHCLEDAGPLEDHCVLPCTVVPASEYPLNSVPSCTATESQASIKKAESEVDNEPRAKNVEEVSVISCAQESVQLHLEEEGNEREVKMRGRGQEEEVGNDEGKEEEEEMKMVEEENRGAKIEGEIGGENETSKNRGRAKEEEEEEEEEEGGGGDQSCGLKDREKEERGKGERGGRREETRRQQESRKPGKEGTGEGRTEERNKASGKGHHKPSIPQKKTNEQYTRNGNNENDICSHRTPSSSSAIRLESDNVSGGTLSSQSEKGGYTNQSDLGKDHSKDGKPPVSCDVKEAERQTFQDVQEIGLCSMQSDARQCKKKKRKTPADYVGNEAEGHALSDVEEGGHYSNQSDAGKYEKLRKPSRTPRFGTEAGDTYDRLCFDRRGDGADVDGRRKTGMEEERGQILVPGYEMFSCLQGVEGETYSLLRQRDRKPEVVLDEEYSHLDVHTQSVEAQ